MAMFLIEMKMKILNVHSTSNRFLKKKKQKTKLNTVAAATANTVIALSLPLTACPFCLKWNMINEYCSMNKLMTSIWRVNLFLHLLLPMMAA